MSDFNYSKDKDNIVSIKWDVNGKSMNVLTLDGMESLKTCVNKALNDKTAKGIIISSSKKDFSSLLSNFFQSIAEIFSKVDPTKS